MGVDLNSLILFQRQQPPQEEHKWRDSDRMGWSNVISYYYVWESIPYHTINRWDNGHRCYSSVVLLHFRLINKIPREREQTHFPLDILSIMLLRHLGTYLLGRYWWRLWWRGSLYQWVGFVGIVEGYVECCSSDYLNSSCLSDDSDSGNIMDAFTRRLWIWMECLQRRVYQSLPG